MSAAVPAARIRTLVDRPPGPRGRFVLYWMTSQRRLEWNFALDRARELAAELRRPLVILEALRCDYPHASRRLHRFMLDGMADHHRRLAPTPITYYPFVEKEPGAGRGLLRALAERAAAVVADDHPGFFFPRMLRAVPDVTRTEAVDGCGLVPFRQPGKAFPRAHGFRRWLQRNLAERLAERPLERPLASVPCPRLDALPPEVVARWPPTPLEQLEDASFPATLPIESVVAPVEDRPGGAAAGRRALRRFAEGRLADYGGKHDPAEDGMTSGLSPYLHFGHVSSHEVFAAVAGAEGWSWARLSDDADGRRAGWWDLSAGAESFLDQLVTWRELGFNAAAFLPDHDRWESLPPWARRTLDEHRGDPRPHLYDRARFDAADTHDALWNAAQAQLREEGRIHTYLRMLWGKKILEWSATPREALDTMLALNDRYALDGRDPNSVSGIFWILGRYDRPWGPEREILGKVRYMSSDNTARKMPVKRYLERFGSQLSF